MHKHVVAIGILGIALLCAVARCEKLEEKLAFKGLECDTWKLCAMGYKTLYEGNQSKTTETKEA